MLLDILFIFCKLNPDVGYRQGMHEVLAPVLWVIERDAVSSTTESHAEGDKAELLRAMFDAGYIEHDTFTLFGLIMQNAKAFYEPGSTARTAKIASSTESPMLVRCRRIFDQLLPAVDPGLADHLKEIDVVPQIFLMWANHPASALLLQSLTKTQAMDPPALRSRVSIRRRTRCVGLALR